MTSACGKSSSSGRFFFAFCACSPVLILFLRRVERFKTSLQFIQLAYGDFYATLDACKVADCVLFVLSPAMEVGAWGETVLRTLQTQGLPDVVPVVAPGNHIDPKARSGILKSLLSFMQYFFPEQSKVFDLNGLSDQLSAVRMLSEGKPRDVRWRQGRSWLLAESVDWMEGNLAITGVVRGTQMSPNRLVHLPNHGDFQVLRVRFLGTATPFFVDLARAT
jgi:pre-rRNA-processing protein TSR1